MFNVSILAVSESTVVGFEAQSLTISCPDHPSPNPLDLSFLWYKWKNGQYVGVATYTKFESDEYGPKYSDDLANGRASLSTSNGDITITSLQLSPINDEATYKCVFKVHVKEVSVQVNGILQYWYSIICAIIFSFHQLMIW